MHGGHYYQSYGSTYISTPTAVFLPDGNTMLSWDDSNGRLMVWNMSTMTISHAHKFSNYGTPAVSHDGNFVTVAVSDQVSIWRLPRFEHVRTIDRPSGGWIRSCALSHDGTLVAIAYSRREDNREFFQVVVYRVSDGQLVLATRTSPSEWFFNPIFSPDGRFLVVRETYDYYSVYRRSDSGFTFAAYVGSSRYSLPRFSPDGRLFALYDSSNLNRIVFYDTSSWTTRGNMYLSTHSSLSTYAFSNDSTLLALGYSRPYMKTGARRRLKSGAFRMGNSCAHSGDTQVRLRACHSPRITIYLFLAVGTVFSACGACQMARTFTFLKSEPQSMLRFPRTVNCWRQFPKWNCRRKWGFSRLCACFAPRTECFCGCWKRIPTVLSDGVLHSRLMERCWQSAADRH